MQAKQSIVTLAVVAAIAAAGAAFAYGPGPQGGGMGVMGPRSGAPMDPALHAERVQARLDALKDALKLQAGQIDAWNAYEARVKSEAQARAQLRQEMQAHRGDPETMADYRVTMMKRNAQAAEEVNGLRKALVAALTPEQQAAFNEYSMHPRFARGPGAGPGYGPGAGGGRGPGFGRGCLGAG
jgi:Spy/CpxP family protein refolding chaperone